MDATEDVELEGAWAGLNEEEEEEGPGALGEGGATRVCR